MIETPSDDNNVVDEPRNCVLLGSGFSRAISDAMPTMPELGERVAERLMLRPEVLAQFGNNLEQFMSFLSVDQPWLTTAENYQNRGAFIKVSEAVYEVITEAENTVLETIDLPDWLLRLAWTWSDAEAQVFSFNYDTLLERAVTHLNRLGTWSDLYAAPMGERGVAGDGGTFGASPPRGKVLRLYKLHGSTSWAFGGLDGPSNDRILLAQDGLRWHPAVPSDEPVAPRDISKWDDTVPLIIPPTLTKGPYFSNLTLRAQWRRAAEALRNADTLTVIGYSFPAADLVAQQWVSTSFDAGSMDIIDHNAERPNLIRQTLTNALEGEDLTGDGAVQRYVDRECGPLVRWRIWTEGDEFGARATLFVNDNNLLEHVRPGEQPWGTEWDAAQRWIHDRVEGADNGPVLDRAQGPLGNRSEERYLVLPLGKTVTI